jgi:hypothetical protein
MAYYLRAFCTSSDVPPLSDVLAWVTARGVSLQSDPPNGWGETTALTYEPGRAPFLVEINRNDGPESLAAQEINEFLDSLQEMKKGRKRDRVIDHLQKTKFIVACQIPTTDIDDAGFHAVDVFLAYFLVHSDGMIQADGQGFYEMGKLIVEAA